MLIQKTLRLSPLLPALSQGIALPVLRSVSSGIAGSASGAVCHVALFEGGARRCLPAHGTLSFMEHNCLH